MKNKIIVALIIEFCLVSCASNPTLMLTETSSPTTSFISPTPTPNYDVRSSNGNILLDFALSPDGSQVAVYTNQKVYIYNIKTQSEIIVEEFDGNSYAFIKSGAIAFTPDGTKIAISGKFANQSIRIWNINLKRWIGAISGTPNGYYVTEIEFSANGERLFARNTDIRSAKCEGPEDALILYNISSVTTPNGWSDTDIYKANNCSIVPTTFRFTSNNRLYLHSSGESPKYSIYIIDANTGSIISRTFYDVEQDGDFYDISSNGQVIATGDIQGQTIISDSDNAKSIKAAVQGKVFLLDSEKRFLVYDFSSKNLSYWQNGAPNCEYVGIQTMDLKVSRNGNFFGILNSEKHELQVWSITNCEKIDSITFDE